MRSAFCTGERFRSVEVGKVQSRPCTACGDPLRHWCLATLMALAPGRAGAVEIEIGEVYGSWD
ncbi:MAG: hypothetical protein ACREXY_25925, partial [Gammaproteobacteria bacterium]